MSQDHNDRMYTNEAPTRCTSGALSESPCPCCGHVRSVRPLAAVAAPPRNPYGRAFDIFRPDMVHSVPYLPLPTVENSLAVHGYALTYTPERRALARTLRPPHRPWTMGQTVDRRLTAIIDVAFLGLALFLAGRLVRATEFVRLAALLAILACALALWLAVALATGRLRRLNGRAQDRYDRALRRWQALLYCEDCGHVFRAGGRGYLPPQAVQGYLERDGPDAIPATAAKA